LVGVSGGPDSVALVTILSELGKMYDLELSLLHVNFGLRGSDSDLDEKSVRDLSEKSGLPLKVVKYKGHSSGNIEQVLRDFRYKEFEKERKLKKLRWVAVGHTLEDQAETVLMNLLRGSGIKGISGIRAKQGKVIRPLLGIEKEEILDYLRKSKIEFRIDKSNFDKKLLRNKIRHKLIPLLRKEYNNNIISAISNMADNLAKIETVVDEYAEKTYNKIAKLDKDKIVLDLESLRNISDELQSLVFRKVVKNLKGDERNLEKAHFFEFRKIIESEKGKNQKLEIIGLKILRKGGNIEFHRN